MRSLNNSLAVMGMVVLALAWSAMAQSAPAPVGPTLDISAAAQNRLTPLETKQIADYISFHLNQLLTSEVEQHVSAAQIKLLDGFRKYEPFQYRYVYAEQSAKLSLPAIAKLSQPSDDRLAAIRQTNLGLWLSSMDREATKSALDQMIRSNNETLRYFGWQGYRRIRVMVLGQGQRAGDEMLAAMAQSGQNESSPVVLGALLQAMQFPLAAPTGVKAESLKNAQVKSLQTVQALWPRLCSQIAGGDEEMANAARAAMPTIKTLAAADPARKTALLQMLVDALYAASRSYDLAKGQGSLADANAMMMCEVEATIGQIGTVRMQYMATAITNPKITTPQDRCTEVGLGVISWIKDLQPLGVVQPTVQAAATSAPASAPAKK